MLPEDAQQYEGKNGAANNGATNAHAAAEDYLSALLDRLFTQEVRQSHNALGARFTAEAEKLGGRIEGAVKSQVRRVQDKLSEGLEEVQKEAADDRKTADSRHVAVQKALQAIYDEQGKLADVHMADVHARLKDLRERGKMLVRQGADHHEERSRAEENLKGACTRIHDAVDRASRSIGDVQRSLDEARQTLQDGQRALASGVEAHVVHARETRERMLADLMGALERHVAARDAAEERRTVMLSEAIHGMATAAAECDQRAQTAAIRLQRWVIAAVVLAFLSLVCAVAGLAV